MEGFWLSSPIVFLVSQFWASTKPMVSVSILIYVSGSNGHQYLDIRYSLVILNKIKIS